MDVINKTITELFQEYKTFCIESILNMTNAQTFMEDFLTETDMMVEFDRAAREYYVMRYDNDPRPDDFLFIAPEKMARRNSKWG